jgi:hypothetical protein
MLKRRRIFPALLACTLLLSLATPAFAVDGCIEINDAKIQAGGGYPFEISSTGCYRLTGNLNLPANKTGLVIYAKDVTLDLNGFAIIGNGSGVGISSVGENFSVFNGTVRGMGTGIYVAAKFNRVEKVRFIYNFRGLDANSSWGGSGMVVGSMFLSNSIAMNLDFDVIMGYSNNFFQSNGVLINKQDSSTGTNLGGNICDGTVCP